MFKTALDETSQEPSDQSEGASEALLAEELKSISWQASRAALPSRRPQSPSLKCKSLLNAIVRSNQCKQQELSNLKETFNSLVTQLPTEVPQAAALQPLTQAIEQTEALQQSSLADRETLEHMLARLRQSCRVFERRIRTSEQKLSELTQQLLQASQMRVSSKANQDITVAELSQAKSRMKLAQETFQIRHQQLFNMGSSLRTQVSALAENLGWATIEARKSARHTTQHLSELETRVLEHERNAHLSSSMQKSLTKAQRWLVLLLEKAGYTQVPVHPAAAAKVTKQFMHVKYQETSLQQQYTERLQTLSEKQAEFEELVQSSLQTDWSLGLWKKQPRTKTVVSAEQVAQYEAVAVLGVYKFAEMIAQSSHATLKIFCQTNSSEGMNKAGVTQLCEAASSFYAAFQKMSVLSTETPESTKFVRQVEAAMQSCRLVKPFVTNQMFVQTQPRSALDLAESVYASAASVLTAKFTELVALSRELLLSMNSSPLQDESVGANCEYKPVVSIKREKRPYMRQKTESLPAISNKPPARASSRKPRGPADLASLDKKLRYQARFDSTVAYTSSFKKFVPKRSLLQTLVRSKSLLKPILTARPNLVPH